MANLIYDVNRAKFLGKSPNTYTVNPENARLWSAEEVRNIKNNDHMHSAWMAVYSEESDFVKSYRLGIVDQVRREVVKLLTSSNDVRNPATNSYERIDNSMTDEQIRTVLAPFKHVFNDVEDANESYITEQPEPVEEVTQAEIIETPDVAELTQYEAAKALSKFLGRNGVVFGISGIAEIYSQQTGMDKASVANKLQPKIKRLVEEGYLKRIGNGQLVLL